MRSWALASVTETAHSWAFSAARQATHRDRGKKKRSILALEQSRRSRAREVENSPSPRVHGAPRLSLSSCPPAHVHTTHHIQTHFLGLGTATIAVGAVAFCDQAASPRVFCRIGVIPSCPERPRDAFYCGTDTARHGRLWRKNTPRILLRNRINAPVNKSLVHT